MNHDQDDLERDLGKLPAPRASEAFRRALRVSFVAGDPRTTEETAPTQVPRAAPRAWSRMSIAAAILIALAAAAWWLRREPRSPWSVLENSSAAVRVDDVRRPESSVASLAQALGRANRVATEAALTLKLERIGWLELGPNSDLAWTSLVAIGSTNEFTLELRAGSLRVITAELAPTTLIVRGPDCDVRVVGTEFAVDILPGMGTCVCCTHGTLEVTSRHAPGEHSRVKAGGMALCGPDGGPTMTGRFKPDHVAPLNALKRRIEAPR